MQEVVFHELQLLHALQASLVRNADDRKREQGKQSTEAAFELQSDFTLYLSLKVVINWGRFVF